jgi:hypothetical protein
MSQLTSASEPCANLANCKIWQEFRTNSKFFWIKQYCQGDKQEQCARAAAKKGCGQIPDNLLPNGELLS